MGLPSDTSLEFRMRVNCTMTEADSTWSNVAALATFPVPANAPSDVSIQDIQTSGGILKWTAGSLNHCTFKGWSVEVQEASFAEDHEWASQTSCEDLPHDLTACMLVGLKCDTTYRTRVRTRCDKLMSNSLYSTISFTTLKGTSCLKNLPAPTLVNAASPTMSSVQLSWVSSSNSSACNFSKWQVEAQPVNSAVWLPAQGCSELFVLNVTECTVRGLQSFMTYAFRVSQTCSDQSSDWGTTLYPIRTVARPADAPTDVMAASPAMTSIQVSWQQPDLHDCTFKHYTLQWRAASDPTSPWLVPDASCNFLQNPCLTGCLVGGLPSLTAITFRLRAECTDDNVTSSWSSSSSSMTTLPRPAESMAAPSLLVTGPSSANVSWLPPGNPEASLLNDCAIEFLGWQIHILDVSSGGGWVPVKASGQNGVRFVDAGTCGGSIDATRSSCELQSLNCDTIYKVRVAPLCSNSLASAVDPGLATEFKTLKGSVACLSPATSPLQVSFVEASVDSLHISWTAGSANDCSFVSWDVQLKDVTDAVSQSPFTPAFCAGFMSRSNPSCLASNLSEGRTYHASVRELCAEPHLSSPHSFSQTPGTTLVVPAPNLSFQLPLFGEEVAQRPSELMAVFDVGVELASSSKGAVEICGLGGVADNALHCHTTCMDGEALASMRNPRFVIWTLNDTFWRHECSYEAHVAAGTFVTQLKPEKPSPALKWSFTYKVALPKLRFVQLQTASPESLNLVVAWDASVSFLCRASNLQSSSTALSAEVLASRNARSTVSINGLIPDQLYEIECRCTLQDEPEVASVWLPADHFRTAKDEDATLSDFLLYVKPLCPEASGRNESAYAAWGRTEFQPDQRTYSIVLSSTNFSQQCNTSSEVAARWNLTLSAGTRSQHANVKIMQQKPSGADHQQTHLLQLLSDEVSSVENFTALVTANCSCASQEYHIQVMAVRLQFEVGEPKVWKSNGDSVSIDKVEEDYKFEVPVTYAFSNILPEYMWFKLSVHLGPFAQTTYAKPFAGSQDDQQRYLLEVPAVSGIGKHLKIQVMMSGVQVGESAHLLSFAPPSISCISTEGYGECSPERLEAREVLVNTINETMLYVKGQGFGQRLGDLQHLLKVSVTSSDDAGELCLESGWVGGTEVFCRFDPRGAPPLRLAVLGPSDQSVLWNETTWEVKYLQPSVTNFSHTTLHLEAKGREIYIIGTNFPDFETGAEVEVPEERETRGRRMEFSADDVCEKLERVNKTHMKCYVRQMLDLSDVKCRQVKLNLQWGSMKSMMQSLPMEIPAPLITSVKDLSADPSEVGTELNYELEGLGFGVKENGPISVRIGDRTCQISWRSNELIHCKVQGPLRDDLFESYPNPPLNDSGGAVEEKVDIPVTVCLGKSEMVAKEGCQPLHAGWSEHAVKLHSCKAGHYRADPNSSACVTCLPGRYNAVDGPFLYCVNCSASTYQPRSGMQTCLTCPAGRATAGEATPSALLCRCKPGFYLPERDRKAELMLQSPDAKLPPCVECPEGAICEGGLSAPVAEPGYWLLADETSSPCTLNGCLGNNLCDVGYRPIIRCDRCTFNYYIETLAQACQECEGWFSIFTVIYAGVFFVFLFGVFIPLVSWNAKSSLDPSKADEIPWLCFGLLSRFIRPLIFRGALASNSADYVDLTSHYKEHHWHFSRKLLRRCGFVYKSPFRYLVQGAEFQRLANILLNQLQILYLISQIGYKYWPESAKSLLKVMSSFLINDVEALRIDCIMPIGAAARWYMAVLLPFFLYACFWIAMRRYQPNAKLRRRITLMVSGACLLYLVPPHLLALFQVFDCMESIDGRLVLELDRGVECRIDDPTWKGMLVFTAADSVILMSLLAYVTLSVYRSYLWYRTAEMGTNPPASIFLTWWWVTGCAGISNKHRAAIQGYKIQLDLPTHNLEASEVSMLCDDLLEKNVTNLKSGVGRFAAWLEDFQPEVHDENHLQGQTFSRSGTKMSHALSSSASVKRAGVVDDIVQRPDETVDDKEGCLWAFGCAKDWRDDEKVWKRRMSIRKASYHSLFQQMERLALQLKTMSSFSETDISIADLLSFAWELVNHFNKIVLGLIKILLNWDPYIALLVACFCVVSHSLLLLAVEPYRHKGLNRIDAIFGFCNFCCVISLLQLGAQPGSILWHISNMTAVAVIFTLVFGTLLFWLYFYIWDLAFKDTFYVLTTQSIQGNAWRGCTQKVNLRELDESWIGWASSSASVKSDTSVSYGDPQGHYEALDSAAPLMTRIVRSPADIMDGEIVAAQWCFICAAQPSRANYDQDEVSVAKILEDALSFTLPEKALMDLSLEQGLAITVLEPELLQHILCAEGSFIDFRSFQSSKKHALPAGLPSQLRLARGGQLTGRIRARVPCGDNKLLSSALQQLRALCQQSEDYPNSTVVSPSSRGSSLPSPSSQCTPALKPLAKSCSIGGRVVPAGAFFESVCFVPPGTNYDDATALHPQDFLARLSRSKGVTGGCLRGGGGDLVLEFRRPDDPGDIHLELCELVLSRDQVPGEEDSEDILTLEAGEGMKPQWRSELALSVFSERAKSLVWEIGNFLLPLDLRFVPPTPQVQLQVSPRPDIGCMQEVLVLQRACQQWVVQAQEIRHYLGLSGEVIAKRHKQKLGVLRASSVDSLESFSTVNPTPASRKEAGETDSDEDCDNDDADSDREIEAQVRTGKDSSVHCHFASRSAWRTPSGGVVFIHDFTCYGGRIELLGRPKDTRAVEQGKVLGQHILWYPPTSERIEQRADSETKENLASVDADSNADTASDSIANASAGSIAAVKAITMVEGIDGKRPPVKGWFDGRVLYWEPLHNHRHHAPTSDEAKELHKAHEVVGLPKDGEIPSGPWVRITSALEEGGVPGPDSGLWTLQTSFFAECHGPLPLQFLEKLGVYQAGKGAKELFERTRRDARALGLANEDSLVQQGTVDHRDSGSEAEAFDLNLHLNELGLFDDACLEDLHEKGSTMLKAAAHDGFKL
eukprot:TRINITY_DN23426_c0_g1_i1.p1 TRINITY_DN23426_c0_g1~~TRINITY_DN23426_c0_g1_i1.p1  ORF type:complete len:3209 (-),score=471.85 TRINITY_DN23426_c0_g1_i1:187-9114(-)